MQFFNPPQDYHIRQDITAGITVGIITIPQAMSFALIAGMPPIYGLYGAFIPLLVYAFLGSSNFLNVGPVSVIAIFIFDALSTVEAPFSAEYVNAVVNLGLMIGCIQLLAGVLQLGRYVEYLPKSIISGFIQAAAVVIIISQLPAAFGITSPLNISYLERLYYLWLDRGQFNLFSTALFLSSLSALFLFAKLKPRFPTAIILLFISGLAAYILDFETLEVALIGEVPQGLPTFILPQYNTAIWHYLPSAFGIAFVTSLGSFVMAKNVESQQPKTWQPNRDLMALGVTKIVSAFFGSLVPAGSFNRSILVIKSGGKTQLNSVVAAMILLLTLLFLTPVVYYLPQSVIAAIIVYSVYFLFDFPLIAHLWKSDRIQLGYLIFTALCTLTLGFVEGIVSGLFIALVGGYFFRTKKV